MDLRFFALRFLGTFVFWVVFWTFGLLAFVFTTFVFSLFVFSTFGFWNFVFSTFVIARFPGTSLSTFQTQSPHLLIVLYH